MALLLPFVPQGALVAIVDDTGDTGKHCPCCVSSERTKGGLEQVAGVGAGIGCRSSSCCFATCGNPLPGPPAGWDCPAAKLRHSW